MRRGKETESDELSCISPDKPVCFICSSSSVATRNRAQPCAKSNQIRLPVLADALDYLPLQYCTISTPIKKHLGSHHDFVQGALQDKLASAPYESFARHCQLHGELLQSKKLDVRNHTESFLYTKSGFILLDELQITATASRRASRSPF